MPRPKGSKNRNPRGAGNRGPYRASEDTPFFQGIERFRQFCVEQNLPFRPLLIDATELIMNHWTGADRSQRCEYRKKLARRIRQLGKEAGAFREEGRGTEAPIETLKREQPHELPRAGEAVFALPFDRSQHARDRRTPIRPSAAGAL